MYRCKSCSIGCELDMDVEPFTISGNMSPKCPFNLNIYDKDKDEKIPIKPIWEKQSDDDMIYSNWCKPIMDEIEAIAKEKYPNKKYWIDIGSRYDACMAMLWQFRDDLKVRK